MSILFEPKTHPAGLTREHGWQVGTSRVVDASVYQIWEVLTSSAGAGIWLAPGATIDEHGMDDIRAADGSAGKILSYEERECIHVQWTEPSGRCTSIVVRVDGIPKGRTRLRFHEDGLSSQTEREQRYGYWAQAIDKIMALV